jgi:hypothetical protein
MARAAVAVTADALVAGIEAPAVRHVQPGVPAASETGVESTEVVAAAGGVEGLAARQAAAIAGMRKALGERVGASVEAAREFKSANVGEVFSAMQGHLDDVRKDCVLLDGCQREARGLSLSAWQEQRDQIDPAIPELLSRHVTAWRDALDRQRARVAGDLRWAVDGGASEPQLSGIRSALERTTAVRDGLTAELGMLRARVRNGEKASA